MSDMISVAESNIGCNEKNGTHMKFINWYGGFGRGTPWCAIFVSYCAAHSGTSTSNVPKYASCSAGRAWFQKHGRYKKKGTYTPKRNDVVFFLNGRSHTGIVEKVVGNTLYTIEGNTSDAVKRRTYSLNNSTISGYGVNYQSYEGSPANSGGWEEVKTYKAEFTAYEQEGQLTASGKRIYAKNMILAAPKDIPFGTKIRIEGTGTSCDGKVYTVEDRGGAIVKFNGDTWRFDIAMSTESACRKFGRRKGRAVVVKWTENPYSGSISDKGSTNKESTEEQRRKQKAAEELAYLNKVLENIKKNEIVENKTMEVKSNTSHANVEVKLLVTNGKKQFFPSVEDGMTLTLERKGSPGKLTFKTVYDERYPIIEGNSVLLAIDGKNVFYGFIFERKRQSDGMYDITCYDQLRYLKNKDTIMYKKLTATKLIQNIAKTYGLQTGKLDNTKLELTRIEDNQTLFDIIQNALDETLLIKNELYVLYDDVGKIRLTNIKNMKNNMLVDEETAQEFSYSSSIDKETYNQIKLGYENKETGTLELFVVRDSKSIKKWGLLQHYEKISDPSLGKVKCEVLLKLYNKKTQTLSITKQEGNTSIRGGSMIPVFLEREGVTVKNYMIVEKVKHIFNNKEHTMDLTLSGGGFNA